MGSRRSKKEIFFSDLERLDMLDDGEDAEELDSRQLSDSPSNTRPAVKTAQKRKATSPLPKPQRTPMHSTRRLHSSTSPSLQPISSPECPDTPGPSPPPRPRLPPISFGKSVQPKSGSAKQIKTAKSKQIQPAKTKQIQTAKGKQKKKVPGRYKNDKEVPEEEQFLRGLTFFFIPKEADNSIRERRIFLAESNGATWARKFSTEVTHVIVEAGIAADEAVKDFDDKEWPRGVPVVNHHWLTEALGRRKVEAVNARRFQVEGLDATAVSNTVEETAIPKSKDSRQSTARYSYSSTSDEDNAYHDAGKPPQTRPNEASGADELDKIIQELQNHPDLSDSFIDEVEPDEASDEEASEMSVDESLTTIPKENLGFQCMNKNTGETDCPNSRTIQELKKLAALRARTDGGEWRMKSYRQAITALRKQTRLIRTAKEAIMIRGIGKSIAPKIEEIVQTGALRQLEMEMSDPIIQLLGTFMDVYGAGRKQAHQWIAQGFRSIDDLKKYAELTPNQQVGVDHYSDFLQRIPREEVEQHAAVVKEALNDADPEIELIIGGSYRRGQADSGDIDILITKKDANKEHIRTLVLDVVVPKLFKSGFLKASLATGRSEEETSKWHGASMLPGSQIWRRLDLLFVPGAERGAALLYFTGNDRFNRSIRLLASRKGMRLNQHGLFIDVMRARGRVKVTEGKLLESRSEKKIFKLLGVPWRPPQERRL